MSRKTIASPYLILGFVLFCWVSLPRSLSDELRSFTVASLAPTWKWAKGIKQYLSDRPERFWGNKKNVDAAEVLRLQLENQILRSQIAKAAQWLESEQHIREQMELLKGLDKSGNEQSREFFQMRASHLRDLLRWELMAMPAQAIYRDPASWSSSMWINVGEMDNRILGRGVIAKNSPVVAGGALVGVVDYVGKRQSRVRLITDSGLSPSVRAVRGENYLAKGELHGSSTPFWRSRSPLLKGIGFHFDSKDPKQTSSLQEGDVLVTTGLDGVFPPDLLVGKVVKVSRTKPGGYAFEIEAQPAVARLNDLQTLFVLPSLSD
jgi:cell shape-determining protein MreC